MYNEMPFINPYNNFNYSYNTPNESDFEKIYDKIARLEKNIRILDTRLQKLENNNNNNYNNYQIDNVNDMHII